MRPLILILLFVSSVFAKEMLLTPEEKTKSAHCIVEGSITELSFSEQLSLDDLWQGTVKVKKVVKGDVVENDKLTFYFNQARKGKDENDTSSSDRCPAYVTISKDMTARFYLVRGNIGSKKNVLILYTDQYVEKTSH
jgi:hypothetical protein